MPNTGQADNAKIATVSCNSSSLSQDASILISAGFKLGWIQVIDQFLFRNHLEFLEHFTGRACPLPKGSKTAHYNKMIKKRSMTIHGHRTSVSLEEPFWALLHTIASRRGLSLASLVQMIDKERDGGLSSALRVFVLAELTQNIAGQATNNKPQSH